MCFRRWALDRVPGVEILLNMKIERAVRELTHSHTKLGREIVSAGSFLNGLFQYMIDSTLSLSPSAGSMTAELMRQALVSDGGYKSG